MTELGSTIAGTSGGDGGDSSSAAPSVVRVGERVRFTVELRPGETTIVSWKKLMKDASKSESGGTTATAAATTVSTEVIAATEVSAVSLPALEARLAPGQPAADEDEPAPNRFSAVIEKIERLYKGKDSSDDEDLNDVPDDDQYDTEDSFIDDAELDEYFQVDKSKTKHDGYFVNRGMLEKVIEPSEPVNQQPKKRRRKEMGKDAGNNDDGQRPGKHVKAVKKGTEKSLLAEKGVLPTSEGPSVEGIKKAEFQNNLKVTADGKPLLDPSLRIPQDDGSLTLAEISDNHKTDISFKNLSGNEDRVESIHESNSVVNKFEESEIVKQQKGKSAMRERIDLNLPDSKHSMLPVKSSVVHKKEGSSVKSKANVLEKAIRELEKMVAELRPPALDAQDGDSSSQCIKRRLPREVKQKLAKVARLAHASSGTVSNELLSRLMGILGHLCQVRTLKRHLKVMVTTSLSAKQEKDEKFRVIKKEVVEMVEAGVPSLIISKATEQQSGVSGDLDASSHSEKGAKGQQFMNSTLEDRICDLYDIFVDGLDEDAAPQVRKLYAELAELWPKGVMDNHGIKRAICRAKERRRTLNDTNKDQEKIRRKKPVTTNTEESAHTESNIAAQSQYANMKVGTDPNSTDLTQPNLFSSTSFGAGTTNVPMNTAPTFTSSIIPNPNGPVHENVIGTHNSSLPATRVVDGAGMAVKKKIKKRAERLVGDVNMRLETFSSHQVDDRHKQEKLPGFQFDPLT